MRSILQLQHNIPCKPEPDKSRLISTDAYRGLQFFCFCYVDHQLPTPMAWPHSAASYQHEQQTDGWHELMHGCR